MFINSITSTSFAASVWANATRTLSADPATDAGAGTTIWTHATRNLTGLNVLTAIGNVSQAIANGATVDLRPASGKFRELWLSYNAATNASGTMGQYDGATYTQMSPSFASGNGVNDRMTVGNATRGQALQNNGTTGTTYSFVGFDWSN